MRQIGLPPDRIHPAEIDESVLKGELPATHARRLASAKLGAVAPDHSDAYVLAADTVVACGRRILPKAEDADTARACLELLSGRRHKVLGAVEVRAPDGIQRRRLVTTSVLIKRLSAGEIEHYLASGEWRGKAGGYAIQGLAASFIPAITGSYSNVVGLPLAETWALLRGLGYRP